MARPIYTLGDAARYSMFIQAECIPCDRKALFSSSDLVNFIPRHRLIKTLPFRCEQCNRQQLRICAIARDFPRTRETIVWRPVREKR